MTKLEKKLVKMGYSYFNDSSGNYYEKKVFNIVYIDFYISKDHENILDYFVDGHRYIFNEIQLYENKKAFQLLLKDFEILKVYFIDSIFKIHYMRNIYGD